MEKVNIFTVRRTEPSADRPINWEHDFPQILNPNCGSIELVRDRRRRLTLAEQEHRKAQRRADDEAKLESFLGGILFGSAGFAAFTALVIHWCGI